MVQLTLEGLGGDRRKRGNGNGSSPIEFYHVDARLSSDVSEIGRAGWKKTWRLLNYIAHAVWCRFRYRAPFFYYIPAPPLKAAIYRDWIVMALCRPFFSGVILHWQAAGLSEWIDLKANLWQRKVTEALLGGPTLSIVLGEYCRKDAERLQSRMVAVIPNAIPDPCPDYATSIEPLRRERIRQRQCGTPRAQVFNVLYIGLCFREKGLFDLLEAVALANQQLQASTCVHRIHLTVAGSFAVPAEHTEFTQRIATADLRSAVDYKGFVSGAAKREILIASDCLAFPTYYSAESFGIVLIEAMAFGLPVVATKWRTIPEILPAGYSGIVQPRSPKDIAAALIATATADYDPRLRERFLARYTDLAYLKQLESTLKSLTAAP